MQGLRLVRVCTFLVAASALSGDLLSHDDSSAAPLAASERQRRRTVGRPVGLLSVRESEQELEVDSAGHVQLGGSNAQDSLHASSQSVDCLWGSWNAWLDCSHSCGGGVQFAYRSVERYAQNGGKVCEGDMKRQQPCNANECAALVVVDAPAVPSLPNPLAVNCQWGEWSEWGACSETCGGGTQEAVREVKVFPQLGGKTCEGSSRKMQQCTPQMECPQVTVRDCLWQEWGEWDVCSRPCGGGQQMAFRQVLRYPQNGGRDCSGNMERMRKCNEQACPGGMIDCEWGAWSDWASCSRSCGGGKQMAFRSVKVYPQGGGANCAGVHFREQNCMGMACPTSAIDCMWGEWLEWGACTKSCGGGVRESLRQIFRYPQNGGEDCGGTMRRVTPCGTKSCPDMRIDCEWGSWGVWSACTASCGGGTQQAMRMISTYPQAGGKNCEGEHMMLQVCNTGRCPDTRVDCAWGAWSAWGQCSQSCGGGTQEAWRRVVTFPQSGGQNCAGDVLKRRNCNVDDCPDRRINCSWGQWSSWEPCSKTCAGGTQRAWREIAVHPQNGGGECVGSAMRWQPCAEQDCPLPGALLQSAGGLEKRERIVRAEQQAPPLAEPPAVKGGSAPRGIVVAALAPLVVLALGALPVLA